MLKCDCVMQSWIYTRLIGTQRSGPLKYCSSCAHFHVESKRIHSGTTSLIIWHQIDFSTRWAIKTWKSQWCWIFIIAFYSKQSRGRNSSQHKCFSCCSKYIGWIECNQCRDQCFTIYAKQWRGRKSSRHSWYRCGFKCFLTMGTGTTIVTSGFVENVFNIMVDPMVRHWRMTKRGDDKCGFYTDDGVLAGLNSIILSRKASPPWDLKWIPVKPSSWAR